MSGRGLSERTVEAYASDLRVFLLELEQESLDQEDFEESAQNWLNGNRKRVAAKTTSRRLTSVRQFAKWAKWGDMLDDYSAPQDRTTMPHPLPEGMDGVRRMIQVAYTPNQKALVAFCGLVGLRVSESLAARPSDFDLHGSPLLRVNGKGDKVRLVPVSDEAWGYLVEPVTAAFIAGNVPVVGLQDRVARGNITQMGRRAGLSRRVASHDLRATFATAVYDKTQNMRLVQELLGHSSVETTQIYVGVRSAALRDAVSL